MAIRHKNKTLATLLAVMLGSIGMHRLYLRGNKDRWLILHLVSVPACMFIAVAWPQLNGYYKLLPLMFSLLIAQLEGLVLGLIPDDQWDAKFNPGSSKQSASGWPLAMLLVAALAVGAAGLIFVITRLIDLSYTGGAAG